MDTTQDIILRIEYLDGRNTTTIPIEKLEPEVDALLSECKVRGYNEGIARLLLYKAEIALLAYDIASASAHITECQTIAIQVEDTRTILGCEFVKSTIAVRQGNHKEGYVLALAAHSEATRIRYTYLSAYLELTLGSLSLIFGAEDDALSYFFSGLSQAKENGYKKMEAQFNFELTQYFLSKEDYLQAEIYATKCINIWSELQYWSQLFTARTRLVTILIEVNKYQEAHDLIEQLIQESDGMSPVTIGTLYVCYGILQTKRKQYTKAQGWLDKAIAVFKEYSKPRLVVNTYGYLSTLSSASGKHKDAVEWAQRMYNQASKLEDDYHITEAYKLLYASYKTAGNVKESLKNLEKYNDIIQKNEKELVNKRVEFVKLRMEYEMKVAEMSEQKRRSELLNLELEHKERELTEKTRHLIKQTEAVAQFRDDLRALIRRTPSDDPIVKSIKERLSNEPDKQLSWREFEEEFKKVHPDYVVKLNVAYPTLTKMEQKICMMLRIGLTSVDIAKLLFLSERNIENHRYRIRKKLSLNSEVSLHEFLAKV